MGYRLQMSPRFVTGWLIFATATRPLPCWPGRR